MKTWAWILGLGGAFTAFAGWMAARAKAQAQPKTAVTVSGVCRVPPGLSASDLATLAVAVNAAAVPAEPCHHDIQEFLDYYAAHRATDGSVTFPDGHLYPSFVVALAAAQG